MLALFFVWCPCYTYSTHLLYISVLGCFGMCLSQRDNLFPFAAILP